MSYKVAFILSMLFIVQLFVFATDLMSVQIIHSNLDAVSVTAGNIISTKGSINEDVIALVQNEAGASIEAIGDETPLFGAVFEYKISKTYQPVFFASKPMEIAVVRSVVIGYYN
ncbi:MAG: hypothetical protein IJQ40_00520 [Bacilli bacterium]|nr:hypothetical protein [Bacilli bacterium]MBR0193867.1 hypothetical protein [Bacilli bacterium]MDY6275939.1 hypothetical protein [Bacilli bacterium]MDY6362806.1 hypothetical protein [Bacilli bacterium]